MSANYYAATNRLLFKVLRVPCRVTVAVDSAAHLHTEKFEVVAYHPLDVGLCMDVPLHGRLKVVLRFGSCRASFAVDVLNPVVLDTLNPIPRSTENLVIVLYPFLRYGRTKRLPHYDTIVIPNNYVSVGERLRPRFYVFNSLCEFIRSAHAIRIRFVIAGVVVIDYVANEDDLITVVTFVGVNAKLEITVQLERAMQVTDYENSPLFTLQVLKGFKLAGGEAGAWHLINPDAVLRFVCVKIDMQEIRRYSYPRKAHFLECVEDNVSASAVRAVDVRC